MAAKVLHLPDADDQVRESVRALVRGRRVKVEEVAPTVGMSPSTMYRKLAGHGSAAAFSAGEAARIAAFFEVSITDLYDGLGGRFLPPSGPGTAPDMLAPAPRRGASARSSTDRASDYGSVVGRSGGAKAIRPAA